LPIETTIILSGAVILVYSTMAGSWGVMATDFLQSLILMILTFVIAALTLIKFGGLSGIKENLEPEKLQLVSSEHSLLWIIAYGFNIFFILSSLVYSPRFLSVTDGKSARKAAAFASVLFFLGPVIWFIPPIAASFYFRDVSSLLPGLNHPEDAAYVLMGLEVLPHGLAGLLIMVVFAATLSSMDTAINQNAAIICMNIYKPIFRPKASPRELFIVAHLANLLFGVLAIFIALIFVKQQQYSLFDLMFILLTCITLPLSVPLVLVYWIKRAPQFSAIISIIAGIAVSLVGKDFAFVAIPHRAVTGLMNRTGFFTLDPALSWPIEISIFAVVITCSAVFLLTVLFWNTVSARQRVKIEKFYDRMNLPVDRETEVLGAEDNRQFSIIGMLAVVVGIGIGLLSLFQGDLKNVLACLCTGLPITLIGLMLRKVKSPQANR
jgi:Na+/proline symporter